MKSVAKRIEEIKNIYLQLDALGIDDRFYEIEQFKKIANAYVRDGIGINGVIPIPAIHRTICYKLTEKENVPCTVVMKFMHHHS